MAGTIRGSQGLPRSAMRILGSYALVYLVAGSGRFADGRGIDRTVSAGDLILLFPEVPHAYGPVDRQTRWDEIYLVFDGPVFDTWRRQGVLDPARPILHAEPIEHWYQRFEAVIRTSAALPRICALQQLIGDLLDHHRRQEAESAGERAWLEQACRLLESVDPARDCDWNAVARKLGSSYTSFRKRFARLAGQPPAQYRARRVIEHACELIQQSVTHGGALTNRELAEACGFVDEFHFSRRFKQMIGLSPSEFRRQMGG